MFKKEILLTCLVAGGIYLLLFPLAFSGYGYTGYSGFSSTAWNLGKNGTTLYTNRNNRRGSVGGPDRLGGGPSSGK